MRIGDATAARLVALTDVGDAAAQNNLGVVLQRGERMADAARAFDRAVALDGGMTVARRNLRALPGDVSAATAAACWARVRADATDVDAWRALVRHHTARGEFDASDRALSRWELTGVSHVAAAVERARWALEAGHPDAALAAVARARAYAGAQARAGDVALLATLDLFEARAAYQRGDVAGALLAVERVRAATPDDAEAELLRSFVLGELGAAQAAVASRARAAMLDPTLSRCEAGVAAGEPDCTPTEQSPDERDATDALSNEGAVDRALAVAAALRHKGYYHEAAATLDPHTVAADHATRAAVLLELGLVHLLRGALADARGPIAGAYELARHSGADAGAPAIALAATRLLAGDLDDAESLACDIAHRDGSALVRTGATTVRALAAWRGGDLATARTHLLDAGSAGRGLDDVTRSALAANLALLLAESGAHVGAARAGAAAIRLAPHDGDAYAAHARALAHAGDHVGARDAFARACALAPDDAAARYGLAFAAGACGDAASARTELARATALSPVVRAPAPRLVLARDGSILVPSDGCAARPAVAGVPSLPGEPERGTAPQDYAHVDARLAAGEYDRALAAADAALARGAPRAEGLVRAGHALAAGGHLARALDRYLGAALAAPAQPEPERYVLRALFGLGRLGDVCERATSAVDRWPEHPGFLALLARAFADRGAAAEAVAALERCAATPRARVMADDPAAFWADVACAWQALGAWDAAADAWADASRAVPTTPCRAIARARALVRAGRVDAADALLEELASTAPELPDVWRARAELAIATGRLPAARAHLARVVGRDAGDVDALAALAAACADASRFDDAEGAAGHALAIDAEHPLALAVTGDCAAAQGDAAAACDAWRRALALSPVGPGAARARAGLRIHAAHGVARRSVAAAAGLEVCP